MQRIARRDKKVFLNEQCKGKENNRTGKTRDLFKKIGDIKGVFHARMGMIKDENTQEELNTCGRFILVFGKTNTII